MLKLGLGLIGGDVPSVAFGVGIGGLSVFGGGFFFKGIGVLVVGLPFIAGSVLNVTVGVDVARSFVLGRGVCFAGT